MPRSISGGATTAKNAQYGSEPICVLGVQWGGGPEIKYAERTTPFATGSITSLSSLSDVIQVDDNSTSNSVSITLSDTDGSLKAILDSNDIHKNRAVLYQWFDGLAESDAFVLFAGEINSPITWNETERTLSFTVMSKIESLEVGFSPEEGQFANVSQTLIGKTWPLVFGEAVHVPAIKSVEKTRGSTQTLIGIPDYTLPYKYWHLQERLQILRDGFQYYKRAIYYLLNTLPTFPTVSDVTTAGGQQAAISAFLSSPTIADDFAINCFFNYIAVTAQGLEDTYSWLILSEDSRRQAFEDINIFITEFGKQSDDAAALNADDSDTTLDADTVEQLQDIIDQGFTDLQDLMNDNPTLSSNDSPNGASHKASIISTISHTIDNSERAIQAALREEDYETVIEEIVKQFVAVLDGAKRASELTDGELVEITGRKEIVEVDIENSEYAFQNIKSLLQKINKLYVNVFKTQREIFKVNTAIYQHNSIPKFQVLVTGGERFPQGTPVSVSVNDMTYTGTFSGKMFTAASIQPRYSGVPVVHSSRTIDSFDVGDPTVDLRGHYCLVSVPTTPQSPDYDSNNPFGYRIFQVTNQVGTRCTMQLMELNPVVGRSQGNRAPLVEDLPAYLWNNLAAAAEHTAEEKKRILEDGLAKYDAEALQRIKTNLTKLQEAAEGTTDDDTIASINETMYKNIREYNYKAANLHYKQEAIDKVNQKISTEEFRNFLRLQNLKYRLGDTADDDFDLIRTDRFYYVTGFDVQYIIASSPVMLPGWFSFAPQGQELEQDSTVITLPNGSRIKANLLPDSGLWYADVGAEVELLNDQREKYIVSILPGEIKAVYAYRSMNGIRQLVPVPSRYYTKNEADNYGGLTCTSITLAKRLQDYPNEGWEEGLYVSIASSVGPNTVDIIEWIAETYTDLVVDSTTFNAVRSALTNYPSSFALFQKKDALTLIREIAWQARCSVWILNGTLYIRYLSSTPSSVATITESHILPDSLELQHTATEELVTKLVATWKPDYSDGEPNKVILRHNVTKYGNREQTYDFYIYNIESLVEKSATFWIIRKSNTWKLASFKTPLTQLEVQALDGVTLDVTPNYFASAPILGVVRSASYSPADNSLDFLLWLPIRCGEMAPYDFAFPSSIDIDKVYPAFSEIAAGYAGAGGSNVPTNVAFNIDPNTNLIEHLSLRPKDYGKPYLSDSYDTLPGSVLGNLSEEDYIIARPDKYQMSEQPRSSEKNAKPEYSSPDTPVGRVREADTFVGRVSAVSDAAKGKYLVKASNNRTYEVQQFNGGTEALIVNSPVTVIRDAPSGQWVVNEKVPQPGNAISSFKIVEERSNFVWCNSFDQTTGEADTSERIPVAKPYLLRKKPFHAQTVEYPDKTITYTYDEDVIGLRVARTTITVTNPGTTAYSLDVEEAQRVVPAYYVGDVILCVKATTGLTTEPEESDPEADNEGIEEVVPIQWTDLNTGGRAWAHSPSNDPVDTDGD